MSDLNLKLVLQALDRGATPTVRRFTATVHGLSREVKAAPKGWIATTSAIGQTTGAAERFNTAGRRNLQTLDALIDRQRRLRREASLLDRADLGLGGRDGAGGRRRGGGLGVAAAGAVGGAVGLGLGLAGGAVITGGIEGTRRIFDEGSQRDGLVSQLAAIEKTRDASKDAFRWIDRFSIKNDQSLEDVTAAYIRLKKKGIDPTGGSLTLLGDVAFANSKSLGQTVEAFLDAQRGQFGALDDYAIEARKVGRQVVFSWDQDGKRMTATSSRTAAGVKKTLTGILAQRDGGAMDRGADDWGRLMRRLGASRDSFLGRIADAGVLDNAKGKVKQFLTFIDEAAGDGRLDAWAQKVSDGLSKALDGLVAFGDSVDWPKLASDIGSLAKAIGALANALGWLNKQSEIFDFSKEFKGGQGPDLLWKLMHPSKDAIEKRQADQRMLRNPWAETMARQRASEPAPARQTLNPGNAPLPGLGGGPLGNKPMSGKLEIGLAPGLVIKSKDTTVGFDLTERRGPAGGRP